MEHETQRLTIARNGLVRPIGPDDADLRTRREELIRDDYNRSHPNDSFEELKRRARFSKEAQGLLHDWMALAAQREQAQDATKIDQDA